MSDLATKADTYAARIELLASSPEPDALSKIAIEARLLLKLLDKAKPSAKASKNKGVKRG